MNDDLCKHGTWRDRCALCNPIERPTVTIPRAQHEALMYEARFSNDALRHKLTTALRALAQENVELAVRCSELEAGIRAQCAAREEAKQEWIATLRGLEAERDEWKQCAEVEAGVRREFKELLEKAEAERDAIRRKTIEECLEKLPEDTPAYVCAAIRALAPTED